MSTDVIVANLTSIKRRIRNINTEYDILENPLEAKNVVQAALREMSTLHNMLPKQLKEKSWAFLSMERGRTHSRDGWK
jgi:hypothetical protein